MFDIDTADLKALQDAATSDLDIIQHFIDMGMDPEKMTDADELRGILQDWVEAGDECTA